MPGAVEEEEYPAGDCLKVGVNEDSIRTKIEHMENTWNNLSERLSSLREHAEYLKEHIQFEKQRWREEIKITANMEKHLRKVHGLGDAGYNWNFETIRNYMFFKETGHKINSLAARNNYEQWLDEIEQECNQELERITNSITKLQPLKDIASKWRFGHGCGDYIPPKANERRTDDTESDVNEPCVEVKMQKSVENESDDDATSTSSRDTITNIRIARKENFEVESISGDGSTGGETLVNIAL